MKATACPRCGATIWHGLDGHVAALPADVDPTPLTVTGEALAVLAGRDTYAVDPPSRRAARTINRRAAHHIGAPDPINATLHAAHICGQPIPPAWTAPPAPSPTTTATDNERCPY